MRPFVPLVLILLGGTALAAPEPNKKYVEANARLGPPRDGERRVVFMGSSAVQGWNLEREFPGRSFVNRGISAENTRQMLARFDQDVIALQPTAVVVHLGGVNDLGSIKTEETIANLEAMFRKARAIGAVPVLFSPTPSRGDHLKTRSVARVKALREAMRELAEREKATFVDVYPLVGDARGELREDITKDGLHLTRAGYELLREATARGIDEALARVRKGGVAPVGSPSRKR